MASELKRQPLTIVAVGPVTNVGTLVTLHPELRGRIERIIMVAGRRPDQRFVANELQKVPHRDFNFELDPAAMKAILETDIPLVFCALGSLVARLDFARRFGDAPFRQSFRCLDCRIVAVLDRPMGEEY